MDFVDWWKKSSKEATEAHYALRFDENELNEIRHGFLNNSAKEKILARFNALKKRNTFLWLSCGIPFLIIGLVIIITLGFFIFRALWQSSSNPIAWIFVGFFVLVVSTMFGLGIYVLTLWLRRRNSTAKDFQTNKVGITRGKVNIKISRSENGFSISYWMNGVEYILFDDAIGWEIHTHFFGGSNITGQSSRETKEDYIFYFLPESKRLLHFELA